MGQSIYQPIMRRSDSISADRLEMVHDSKSVTRSLLLPLEGTCLVTRVLVVGYVSVFGHRRACLDDLTKFTEMLYVL